MNSPKLFHETTAIALSYGFYKTDLSETDQHNVAFVVIGNASMQVCIAGFKKGQLKVLAYSSDSTLGGRDFDDVLFQHFAAKIKEEHKIDVYEYPSACRRLESACGKLKKVLSSNPAAPLNIECLMEEKDVMGFIEQDEFELISVPILERVKGRLDKALSDAGLSTEDIDNVEFAGSGACVLAITKLLTELFKKEPRTMNANESVAIGCALQCAMGNQTSKFLDFKVLLPSPLKHGSTIAAFTYGRKKKTKVTRRKKKTKAGLYLLADTRDTILNPSDPSETSFYRSICRENSEKVVHLTTRIAFAFCGVRSTMTQLRDYLKDKVETEDSLSVQQVALYATEFLLSLDDRDERVVFSDGSKSMRHGDCSVIVAGLDTEGGEVTPAIYTIQINDEKGIHGKPELVHFATMGAAAEFAEVSLKDSVGSKADSLKCTAKEAILLAEESILYAAMYTNGSGNSVAAHHILVDENSSWEVTQKSILDIYPFHYCAALESHALIVTCKCTEEEDPDLKMMDKHFFSAGNCEDKDLAPSSIILGWRKKSAIIRVCFCEEEEVKTAFGKCDNKMLAGEKGSNRKFYTGTMKMTTNRVRYPGTKRAKVSQVVRVFYVSHPEHIKTIFSSSPWQWDWEKPSRPDSKLGMSLPPIEDDYHIRDVPLL